MQLPTRCYASLSLAISCVHEVKLLSFSVTPVTVNLRPVCHSWLFVITQSSKRFAMAVLHCEYSHSTLPNPKSYVPFFKDNTTESKLVILPSKNSQVAIHFVGRTKCPKDMPRGRY